MALQSTKTPYQPEICLELYKSRPEPKKECNTTLQRDFSRGYIPSATEYSWLYLKPAKTGKTAPPHLFFKPIKEKLY
jgi:hypothetical protein